MRYRDLTDESKLKRHAMLVCMAGCDGEYSAHADDYFYQDPDDDVLCRCGGPMMRVLKRTRYVGV